MLSTIQVPNECNYIACFLTLECNMGCSYCINNFSGSPKKKKDIITGKQWVHIINRLITREDLPVTLQGGEPSLHPDFIWILNNIKKEINIDILTNLSFDLKRFIKEVSPSRLKRMAPYASIRVSYHPDNMDLQDLITKVDKLQNAGFEIGVYGILHPLYKQKILEAQKEFLKRDIDFRTKEFLGKHENILHGTYLYPGAVAGDSLKTCQCKTTEILIDPSGNSCRCHHYLYDSLSPLGNFLEDDYQINNEFLKCSQYGNCNPCDIKIKTNRFQEFGHTSVEIRDVEN